MSLTKNYRVYKHANKANGKVYIGITKQTLERRWQNGYGYKDTYFGNAIKKYGWDGFTHELIKNGLSKDEACTQEKELISQYKSNNREYGYNICEGGQIGDNLQPHYGADNCRAVAILQIDKNTGEIKRYKTMKDAVNATGFNHRGISKACRGVSKTYKGYIWEYADIDFKKPDRYPRGKYSHDKIKKKVLLINPDGSELVFDSRKSAADYVGLKQGSISRYIYGLRIDQSGRRWSECL